MTVGELIVQLQQYDQSLHVHRGDSEYGGFAVKDTRLEPYAPTERSLGAQFYDEGRESTQQRGMTLVEGKSIVVIE